MYSCSDIFFCSIRIVCTVMLCVCVSTLLLNECYIYQRIYSILHAIIYINYSMIVLEYLDERSVPNASGFSAGKPYCLQITS